MAEKDVSKGELIKALRITFNNSLREDCWPPEELQFANSVLDRAEKVAPPTRE